MASGGKNEVEFTIKSEGPPLVNLSKERMEVSFRTVIESDVLKYYKKCKVTIPVTPKGDESLVKWTCEYFKASEDVAVPVVKISVQ